MCHTYVGFKDVEVLIIIIELNQCLCVHRLILFINKHSVNVSQTTGNLDSCADKQIDPRAEKGLQV